MRNVKRSEILWFRKNLLSWAENNHVSFPWRKTKNRWHALTAEVMLQRTRAEQVLLAYQEFSEKFPTPDEFLKEKSAHPFRSLGLAWREKEFLKLARVLSSSSVPEDRASLLKLPGVGFYIAAAFRSFHVGEREPIIDSNVVRLYGRFFGFQTDAESRRKKWLIDFSEYVTPQTGYKDYNYALIDFTRAICKPRPQCPICILRSRCYFYQKHNKMKNSETNYSVR